MTDANDRGGLVPRDTAERVLRLAIEMEARRGEVLTEDELFRIAHDVGVHPEYVRRALDAERAAEVAAERQQHERRHARHGREPLPMLNRVMLAVLGIGILLSTVVMGVMGIGSVPELLADGLQLMDAVTAIGFVLAMVLFGGMGWMSLSLSWDPNA
ncbi:MAG TPA: hypothetical protein VGB15_20435 [Longimicrobium sp.]|jgi:hypothetical protein